MGEWGVGTRRQNKLGFKTEDYLSERQENKAILNLHLGEKSMIQLRSVLSNIQANDLDEEVGNESDVY